jgi:hypothetical protein
MGICCCTQEKNFDHSVGHSFIMSRARAGDMKKQYDIDEKRPLGEGSFGKVFRARSKENPSHIIAIKQISKRGLDKNELLSLEREVTIMQ